MRCYISLLNLKTGKVEVFYADAKGVIRIPAGEYKLPPPAPLHLSPDITLVDELNGTKFKRTHARQTARENHRDD